MQLSDKKTTMVDKTTKLDKNIARKEYRRQWREKNRQKLREYNKNWYKNPGNKEKKSKDARLRNQLYKHTVLLHYSNNRPRCQCPHGCTEVYIEFLCLDHINGGGNAERRRLFNGKTDAGGKMYRWLIKNNFPPGYRVLCHNCNHSLGAYGHCPHERRNNNAT